MWYANYRGRRTHGRPAIEPGSEKAGRWLFWEKRELLLRAQGGGELVSVRDTRGRQDAESRKGWSLALTLRERRGGVCVHCSWQSRVLRSFRRSDDGKESGHRDCGGYVIPRRLAPRRTAQVGRFLSFAPCRRRQESVRQLVLSMGRARSLIRLLKPVRLFLERCIW